MDRARRRDGRAGRRAAAHEPVERRGREGRGGRDASAGHRQVAAVIPPPRLVAPETAAAAKARGPTQDELFSSIWGSAGPNNVDSARGHRWIPLPAKAPAAEWSFFYFGKSQYTSNEVADLLLKSLYENDCNNVADKRREICHCLARSAKNKEKELDDLEQQLGRLMATLQNKANEILESSGYAATLPTYFYNFPALEG